MPQISESVLTLERDLRHVFGDRLRSVVAFGLHGNDHRLSQTLIVLDAIGEADLRACAARAAAWHRTGLATPLLVGAQEFARSLDAFPLEFGAIVSDHVLVSGSNPFEGLRIDPADLRRACEVQARSHLLHLREGFIETLGRDDALGGLIVRSAAAFGALLQSVARLNGAPPGDLLSTGRHIEPVLDVPAGSVTNVLRLAGVHKISPDAAARLFPGYLRVAERLVAYVDRWGT